MCDDFAHVGDDVFVADDLFWYHPSRSLELALALRKRGIRKSWVLVQSRVDTVARHPELLEAWRPIAREFDIFFGLEAATDDGLKGLAKDATVGQTEQAIAIARELGFGVTGNFVIDPAWTETDFKRLWDCDTRLRSWVHHPDTLPGSTSRTCGPVCGAEVGALRHAPPAVGPAPPATVFRALLRNVAAFR